MNNVICQEIEETFKRGFINFLSAACLKFTKEQTFDKDQAYFWIIPPHYANYLQFTHQLISFFIQPQTFTCETLKNYNNSVSNIHKPVFKDGQRLSLANKTKLAVI